MTLTTKPSFSIRPLVSIQDFAACEEIQRQVWGPGDAEVVPMHMLVALARNGGIVLGAFDRDRMIGFVFGILATAGQIGPAASASERLRHHSHMLAVLPKWRDMGVGFALKLAQREAAHAQGLRLMTWTYDPLQSRNALFNIAKLGAVCKTYYSDYYGEMLDELNVGLPSDRFLVEWHFSSQRVAARLSSPGTRRGREHFVDAGAVLLNPARLVEGLPRPAEQPLDLVTNLALVEIPADFSAVKNADKALALAWRLQTREIFEGAFEHGYMVVDYVFESVPRRGFYVLMNTDAVGESNADRSMFADDLAPGDRANDM
jgi:predicted GNAT superfamily acetyltransferase